MLNYCRRRSSHVMFFLFFPLPSSPQLMPFSWFPLWCCMCPTLGHSASHGDTPKYINSLTHSETHWFVPKYPVNCEKDRLHKSSPRLITSISCHLKNIFMIWGPFMRKVMADWHQMCHKLSTERCQAKQSSINIQRLQIYWSLQIQILLVCARLFQTTVTSLNLPGFGQIQITC